MELLEIIKWHEFQKGIAPLWGSSEPEFIPIFNNPYGIIQYDQKQWHTAIVYFPCRYSVDDVVVGYTSIYNVSDIHIRLRGIYILNEYQGCGLGHRMQQAAQDLFPKSFYRSFIFTSQPERFCKYGNMKMLPNVGPIWSTFGQNFQRILYINRDVSPTEESITQNKRFIDSYRSEFNFGGTNNLNCNWTGTEWEDYFIKNAGNYINLNMQLD